MKIGIVYYSGTGNTRLVSIKLEEALTAKGHKVTREEIRVEGTVEPGKDSFTLKKVPDVSGFDGIVFASPVMAFSLNPVMKKYLSGLASLEGKRVALLITKHLPFGFTGANQAFGKMTKLCKNKGAVIQGRARIVWSSKQCGQMIVDAVNTISDCF